MASFREIRRRIKGVKNTRQITKTMEMVAASRMRKAQSAALQMRAYAEKALQILNQMAGPDSLASAGAGKAGIVVHPLLEKREVKHTTIVLITSDRGLCGGLNSSVIAKAVEKAKMLPKESIQFITLGKKGRDAIMRQRYKVAADFSGLKKFEFEDVFPVISMALDEFTRKKTDKVLVIYPHFVNAMTQKPVSKTLLPLSQDNLVAIAQEMAGIGAKHSIQSEASKNFEYKFEPDMGFVLQCLLPRFTEMQIFKAALESQASEHSARMAAMRNATDAAGEIIDDLTFSYNQIRQSGITSEIAEICTAAEALK